MKRDDAVCINDILECVKRIEEYTKDADETEFCSNVHMQDSVFRRLEIIGEAAKNLSPEFREKYSDVPWKEIIGLRDVLIHAYFGIKLKRTWRVVELELPELKEKMKNALKNL